MPLETLSSSNDLPSILIYDTIHASQMLQQASSLTDHTAKSHSAASCFFDNVAGNGYVPAATPLPSMSVEPRTATAGQQAKRKRRRRPRTCKNREDAENQRMTHIAVERNRRRQMNEYLAVLRSLMPESYIQRGDQASIVGGAIDYVKELEQQLQSLEARKRTVLVLQKNRNQYDGIATSNNSDQTTGNDGSSSSKSDRCDMDSPPFAQFFSYPQYIWCHAPSDCPTPQRDGRAAAGIADIEVTLIETHANIRILSLRRPGQLLKLVAGLQTLRLAILHLNVTTMDSMVLYSFSVKVEDECCNLTTVDDIATAVHHVLSLIEADQMTSLVQ